MPAISTPHVVLIVEDHDDTRAVMRTCLELAGFRVAEARTGSDALAQLATVSPQVVTLDLGLPDADGIDVARSLRQHPVTRSVPIVAITGWAYEPVTSMAKDAGCDVVVKKPCPAPELVSVIRRVLASRFNG